MKNINYEIKARTSEEKQNEIKEYLKNNNAEFIGTDNQIDTYFKVPHGRLKIRKGNIENKLVYYERDNGLDSKKSNVLLVDLNKSENLERITRKTHDVLVEVDKSREIYWIENVKFHIDNVGELGKFMEIEAISKNNSTPETRLKEQCNYYKNLFGIKESDLIENSYSDMIIKKQKEAIK